MKLTDNAKLLLQKRYCRGNENPYDVYPRVADRDWETFYHNLHNIKFFY